MALIIGLDTGGTFTDAALLDTGTHQVLATAKSLTTRDNLAIGVSDAMRQILGQWAGKPDDIGLVSLSTTLATNAVVEGIGGAVGLVLIGFDEDILSRASLASALGSDPVIHIAGGHKTDGKPQSKLDTAGLAEQAQNLAGRVSSFAVAGHFATRNPEHEEAARQILTEHTGLPVTCSSELSSALGGPRRALTALLNARLIGLLDQLITATDQTMASLSLNCPLMVVKGDGSLLKADIARMRPVETVLSGPAASLAGAAFLANEPDGMVSDIGGTTTDIALLEAGMPRLSEQGATVGGWQTMVEAARIRTSGLGGDSEVRWRVKDSPSPLTLGPRRAVPLSLLATQHPEIKTQLEHQLAQAIALPSDGKFILPVMPDGIPDWLSRSEKKLAEQASNSPYIALADIATTQVALGAIDRLIAKGLVMQASFTPTDAVHILGKFTEFDTEAAVMGGKLLARQKTAKGTELAKDETALAHAVCEALIAQSAIALMDAAFAEDGKAEHVVSSSSLLSDQLRYGGEDADIGLLSIRLSTPLIALGASSSTHYPAIADRLQTQLVNPPHADVAGAVGAAAGAVRQRFVVIVTQPQDGCFRIHLPDGPQDVTDQATALSQARTKSAELAEMRARTAGAKDISVQIDEVIDEIDLGNNKTLFLQARFTAQAIGLPSAG